MPSISAWAIHSDNVIMKESSDRNIFQRRAAGICFILVLAIFTVIGLIDGNLLGGTPRQKIVTLVIAGLLVVGTMVLFLSKGDKK